MALEITTVFAARTDGDATEDSREEMDDLPGVRAFKAVPPFRLKFPGGSRKIQLKWLIAMDFRRK